MTMPYLRWITVGALSLGALSCRSTTDTPGTVPPVGAEFGDVTAIEEPRPAPRGRALFSRAKKEQPAPSAMDTYPPPPEGADVPPAAEDDDRRLLRSSALDDAYLHYELGDYDFATAELRKIRAGSPNYAEAQALLKKMQRP